MKTTNDISKYFFKRSFYFMKQQIPNILSSFRIILSPLLLIPAIIYRPAIYFPLYAFIFFTDILDGRIARRLRIESALGTKLDSLGDILFFACAFGSVIISPLVVETRVLISMAIGFGLYFVLALATFVKFKVLNATMHTYFAKLLVLALAIIIPISMAMGRISFPVVAVYVGLTVLNVIEGLAIVVTSKTYNGNHRGIVAEKMIAKQGKDGWFNKIFHIIFY